MNTVQSPTAHTSQPTHPVTQSLHAEVTELDALNTGLKLHVAAWQAAHITAVSTMTSMLERMDSILARIDRNRS